MQNFIGYKRVQAVAYDYSIESLLHPGYGYSFPCDQYGNILEAEMSIYSWQSFYTVFEKIYSGEWAPPVIKKRTWSYVEYAHGDCVCGAPITLYDPMTNECEKCGTLYNGGGQMLAPRSQWDYDTYDTGDDGLFNNDDIVMMGGY